ncbi:CheA signal transduction histidine kinase [Caballeronia novacaledonica]|uniref:Chemotaxis protein CheA n=1 Tax=Caballeronia novacaledonica TaxID=1544861 RepID=A0A2U3HYJ9_9BURK|nr:ATP-binding protein [Caballeronia novacaledonica]SPB12879.1 CheA signal transduction histidine kinase [Caballeronia novacaledonica]
MTIRHRIVLLVVLMLTALAVIGGYAVKQTRDSSIEVHQVTQGVVPSALASADLVAQVKDVQIATMTLVYAPDPQIAAQARELLAKREDTLKAALDLQDKEADGAAQKGLVVQARESLANYFDAIKQTADMQAAGKSAFAQAFLFANVAQYKDELQGIVETLRIEKNRQKDAAIDSLNDALATTSATIAAATGVAVAVLIGISVLLYRQISLPLSRMQTMMSEIASSQDFTRRVPVGRMDEIGCSIVAFNGMIEKIQESSLQLKQRTADIQAILQNMPQGILTVVPGAAIHPEYSAFLEAIFETNALAGRPVLDVVFGNTDIGSDELAQLDAAIDACLGEDIMNFDFNRHLLVDEVVKDMGDGRKKVLDLSWSAITNEEGVIVRLMLCVRDVTELKALAAEAGEQRRRLDMIGEVLAISQEKFERFMQSAASFVGENERIIREHDIPSKEAIAQLFRNMHTVKGNARTYSLQHLTGVVHDTEQRYDALRQPDGDTLWNRDEMIADLERVRAALQSYATVNDVSLGRKTSSSRDDSASYLRIDREFIQKNIELLAAADANDAQALGSVRDSLHRMLSILDTESIASALEAPVDSLPSLAKELGKEAPRVSIEDNGYRVSSGFSGPLANVFTHLLRNSIDHGIETASERVALGKPDAGSIRIDVNMEGDALRIALADDGRGLALDRIRKTAIERGWLDTNVRLDDEAVAELIFRPGFSTAQSVTEVSGRGVGMDAVREFVAREGGRIELRFIDGQRGAAYRKFETIVFLPAGKAVDSLGVSSSQEEAESGSAAVIG